MDDAFRVDLVQTQQQVSSNDLDVTQIESLTSIDEILEEIGWPRWQFELFRLLNFLQDSVFIALRALSLNFLHQRAAHHACWLFSDEEEHILRLVHVLDLAKINRLLQFCQC